MGLSREQLVAFRGGTLPDLVGPGTRLLFVGFNPGLRSVAMQAPFSLRSNRFWPALYRAGILDRDVVATTGLSDDDRAHVLARGVGIISLDKGAGRLSHIVPPHAGERLVPLAAVIRGIVEGRSGPLLESKLSTSARLVLPPAATWRKEVELESVQSASSPAAEKHAPLFYRYLSCLTPRDGGAYGEHR